MPPPSATDALPQGVIVLDGLTPLFANDRACGLLGTDPMAVVTDGVGPLVAEGDRATLRLLRRSPFPPGRPPRFVRARLFRYRFTTWRELRDTGACWERTYVREFLPPTRLAGGAAREP